MKIIGGIYRESSTFPRTNRVFGSGLKAAAAISASTKVELTSCVDPETRFEAESIFETYGIETDLQEREAPVTFDYYTPVSKPLMSGSNQQKVDLSLINEDANVLLFGMVEANINVVCSGLVYDPQQKTDLSAIKQVRDGAQKLALVANTNEIRRLGKSNIIGEAAVNIIADSQVDVVVVKRGALGARVIEAMSGNDQAIECYRTESVWPIGSGDVFSAVFAWAWLEDFREPADAARLASAAASVWCSTQSLPLDLRHGMTPLTLAKGRYALPVSEDDDYDRVPVYLASPFFTVAELWLVDTVRIALEQLGADVFSPYHEIGLGGDEVAIKDIEGLLNCKSVFAILDGADAGTIYEVGYAASKGIPTVGYTSNPESSDFVMLRGMGAFITDDLSTAVYRAIWAGMTK